MTTATGFIRWGARIDHAGSFGRHGRGAYLERGLILLHVALAIRVVASRRKHKVLFGDGGVQAMTLATRAFGNAAEYIPLDLGAMILMAMSAWFRAREIHLFGLLFLTGRIVHGFDLRFGNGPGASRVIGMTLTLLPLSVVAVPLIVRPHLH